MSADEAKRAMEAECIERTRQRHLGRRTTQPGWMLWFVGRPYRTLMRLMHRWGWCYPQRNLMGDGSVWCQWCGMRGRDV